MNILSFVSNLVASLAWPVTAIVALLLVRRILVSMVPLIRRLKYSDLEVSFGREVAAIRDAADAAAIEPSETTKKSQAWEDLIRLAAVRPRSAVREAWRQVESALINTAKTRNLQIAPAVCQCRWCLVRSYSMPA